jgi:hypothetical protein
MKTILLKGIRASLDALAKEHESAQGHKGDQGHDDDQQVIHLRYAPFLRGCTDLRHPRLVRQRMRPAPAE